MRRATVAILMLFAFTSSPGAARAYSDWGWDRRDVSDHDLKALDLARTRRDVQRSGGQTLLRFTFDVHGGYLSNWWGMEVFLDTRGSSKRDYAMHLVDADQSGRGCDIWKVGHRRDTRRKGHFNRGDGWARCRVPVRWVEPDKKIRWKVRIHTNGELVDRAPDGGWYR